MNKIRKHNTEFLALKAENIFKKTLNWGFDVKKFLILSNKFILIEKKKVTSFRSVITLTMIFLWVTCSTRQWNEWGVYIRNEGDRNLTFAELRLYTDHVRVFLIYFWFLFFLNWIEKRFHFKSLAFYT